SMQEQTRDLTQAVAAFNVGKAATAATAGRGATVAQKEDAPAPRSVERRGPNRAPNIARLPDRPKAQPAAAKAKAKSAVGGEEEQWEEF
ncbi:MAG: methyl-accepting chemotaxis protein, partial [Burkholderiales bacterium]|nr:methyl-accepting chemotaxis protein [Burkholderiales bacterium]